MSGTDSAIDGLVQPQVSHGRADRHGDILAIDDVGHRAVQVDVCVCVCVCDAMLHRVCDIDVVVVCRSMQLGVVVGRWIDVETVLAVAADQAYGAVLGVYGALGVRRYYTGGDF